MVHPSSCVLRCLVTQQLEKIPGYWLLYDRGELGGGSEMTGWGQNVGGIQKMFSFKKGCWVY